MKEKNKGNLTLGGSQPEAPPVDAEPKTKEVATGLTEIKASKVIDDVTKECSIMYNFGSSLDEARQLFGDAVVHTNFIGKAKITAQASMRRMLETGKDATEIATRMSAWKPGVAMERVIDPVAGIMSAFPTMSEEAQIALLDKLKKARANK